MTETLSILKGEGEKKQMIRVRRKCDICGEPAHFKHTFLLPNCRSNPASSAYRHDDCSWCSDAEQYSCKNDECKKEARHIDGYSWCSTFPAINQFAHIFLEWKEIEK